MTNNFKNLREVLKTKFRMPVEMFTLFNGTEPFQRDVNGNPIYLLYNLRQFYYMYDNHVFIHPDTEVTDDFVHTEDDLIEMYFFDMPYRLTEFRSGGKFKNNNKNAQELSELTPVKMFVGNELVPYDGSPLIDDKPYLYKSKYKINYANFFATHSLPTHSATLDVINYLNNLRTDDGNTINDENGENIFYIENTPTYIEGLYENVKHR